MLKYLERAWRIVATAIAFTSFGLGGVWLWLVYFPLLRLFVRDEVRRRKQARLLVHRSFRLFIEWMRLLGILDYQIRGRERLQRNGLLILANHPTLLDVVFLISLVPNADCVVKASLARNPFTRGAVDATGYISNESGAGLIEDCVASLQAGNNLIIFPEGTRSVPGQPLKMQRGAANIAIRGACNITPVQISCQPPSLSKGLPWWRVPERPMSFCIAVEPDLSVAEFLADAQGEASRASRLLTDYLLQYFSMESVAHAGVGT